VEDGGQLIARVRARDAAAFERLYDAYHRLVYGVAMRVLGERSGAEDVTQAVFMKVWNAPEKFASGNLAGWLVRVARNSALDLLRNRSRQPVELPEHSALDDGPEAEVFARLDALSVRSALEQLPPEQREPIESGFFGGLTHEEIARNSGVPLGTVKTRIRSGLLRLRATLDGAVRA